MSPLTIKILLHYYAITTDYSEDHDIYAAQAADIDWMVGDSDLLYEIPEGVKSRRKYNLTDRGRFYVEAILAMPLPVNEWSIPTPVSDADEK